MTAVYFKVKCNFDILSSENKEQVITQLENINPNSLDIQAINKDERKIAFHAEINDIKSGEMSFKKEDDAIKIKCDAIFKINVRPQHVADVMDSETQWYCNGIEEYPGNNIIGTINGLEQEKYKWKNFQGEGESIRYKIPLKVGNKIKDL